MRLLIITVVTTLLAIGVFGGYKTVQYQDSSDSAYQDAYAYFQNHRVVDGDDPTSPDRVSIFDTPIGPTIEALLDEHHPTAFNAAYDLFGASLKSTFDEQVYLDRLFRALRDDASDAEVERVVLDVGARLNIWPARAIEEGEVPRGDGAPARGMGG